jgi:predicted Zn-dependent protease
MFGNIGRALGRWIPGGEVQTALDLLKHDQVLSSSGPSAELSPSRRRTYDQTHLATIIRKLVDPDKSGEHLMIITDRPITPPADWRYIIWETDPNTNASVISVSPLDPEYWRDQDPRRVMRIKTRTRNAALSITGELIGLERCENPACFLFDDVDSVTVLDEMRAFGAEHDLSELVGYGFDEMVSDPTLVQTPTFRPISKRAL